ncbi:MAG: porin [Pelagibacteraceae bacterium]|jgi:hypothetical protein|nr:porin [Pelagibacteraceae bacterium]MCI5079332.1 porin [Pelagibacteraceae bacterium]
MKKQLLLTTAIAGLVAVSGAHAETKISGNLEQTWKNVSDDASNGAASTEGFGTEYNIGLSSSAELDNGMSASFGINFESTTDAANKDVHYLTLGLTDALSISFAQDNGNNLSGSAVPHISDTASTVVGAGFSNLGIGASDGHNDQHIRVDAAVAGGTFTVRYVPNDGHSNNGASSTAAEASNSATDFIYKGSLGVEGLGILVGQHTADRNSVGGTDLADTKYKVFGASYNFGQFSVGAERAKSEGDVAASTARGISATADGEKDEMESTTVGVTFAASDKVSLGLVRTETTYTDNGTEDPQEETTTMLGVGYSLGGVAIDINYAQTENVAFGTTDRDTLQIRTIQKF